MFQRSDAVGVVSVPVKTMSVPTVPVKSTSVGVVPVKSASVGVVLVKSPSVFVPLKSPSVEKLSDVKIIATKNDENLRPREGNFTCSDQLGAYYEDFIKWKRQQKRVEPYKQFVKEIASTGHVFSNVSNCQIVVLNSDFSSPCFQGTGIV
jgi:hypothetical protein